MPVYQVKLECLRACGAVWQVEAAPMDRIAEAFFLGGDFARVGERTYHYVVWNDAELGRWFAGFSRYGAREVPFSRARCGTLGGYGTLRDALRGCEEHAALWVHRGG